MATGPRFRDYTTTRTLTEYEWKFRQSFIDDIGSIGDLASQLDREIMAEFLLREGIVQALWSVSSPDVLPPERRWRASIEQLAREIPAFSPLKLWVIELLSGMPDPSHYNSYVSDDGLKLEPVPVPPDVE